LMLILFLYCSIFKKLKITNVGDIPAFKLIPSFLPSMHQVLRLFFQL